MNRFSVARVWARAVRLAAAVLVGSLAAGACSREDDGTRPQAAEQLPALTIRDETPNLLLTWVDDQGGTHVEVRPADVPAAGRPLVRVVLADREEGTRDVFYVADLGRRQGDGSYATRSMPRREWESILEQRRREYLAKHAPPPRPPGSSGGPPPPRPPQTAPPVTGLTVVIYGADWCKPCHQAADYLTSISVPHVVKDVERDEDAAREMSEKLTKAGRRGSGIPVIDVRGQILVGFSKSEIDRALKKAGTGTVL